MSLLPLLQVGPCVSLLPPPSLPMDAETEGAPGALSCSSAAPALGLAPPRADATDAPPPRNPRSTARPRTTKSALSAQFVAAMAGHGFGRRVHRRRRGSGWAASWQQAELPGGIGSAGGGPWPASHMHRQQRPWPPVGERATTTGEGGGMALESRRGTGRKVVLSAGSEEVPR
jgi:hypothetical protein